MNFNSHNLRALTHIFAPSSHEDKLAEFIIKQIKDYVDDIKVDKLGNVIAHKVGKGPKLMLAAHMDSIGFMVKSIDEKGFLKMSAIGGISPLYCLYQSVIFKDGLEGVIANQVDKHINDKLKVKDLYVDIGAKDKKQAQSMVEIGDFCVYKSNFSENANTITSTYLDNRVGCFVLIEAIKMLGHVENDCYFTFTVQEEVGVRGARTATFSIEPDYGIAVDVSPAGDVPGEEDYNLMLHEGVAIKARDGSLLPRPALNAHIKKLADDNNIKYQIEILDCCGTDAGQMSLSRDGVPSSCLSIPSRGTHSPYERVSKHDVSCAIELLLKICSNKYL